MLSTASLLGVGLVFGLKHALEADHLAAISTIVNERKSLLSSSMVGALWGVGHTISLLAAGVAVIILHVHIGERMALTLEFGVALMLIGLGVNSLRMIRRGGHVHVHAHGGRPHLHAHEHAETTPTHHRIGLRPLLIGMIHGLAGSTAVMLLVLSTIPSPLVGFLYIVVFGVGSIGGMLVMSLLVGLPTQLTALRFGRVHLAARTLAALFSLGIGLLMAYRIGFINGLLA